MLTLRDKIKELPVSSVIGNYINLTSKGNLKVGLCPFHADSHPSLQVNDAKGLFMCFVCNIGGDAISFVQKFKQLEFLPAMEDIAKLLQIPYNLQGNDKSREATRLLEFATKLFVNAGKNHHALKAFQKERELTPEIIDRYRIGVATQNLIVNHLQKIADGNMRSKNIELALKIHLIRKNENRMFDALYDRIIFPIMKANGEVVGFSGKAISNKQQGKYINSQDSFVFNKKRILYGLNFARASISKEDRVILVEGYMDHISLAKYGIDYSVAIMGISLSDEAFNELTNLTKNIYIGTDNDAAGMAAADRINDMATKKGIVAYYIDYDKYKDADEFLKAEGRENFINRIKNAKSYIDVKIEKMLNQGGEGIKLIEEIFKILRPLGEGLHAIERIIKYAKEVGLAADKQSLVNSYRSFLKKGEFKSSKKVLPMPVTSNTLVSHISNTQKTIIGRLIEHPQVFAHAKFNELLELIESQEVVDYFKKVKALIFEIEDNEYVNMIGLNLDMENTSLELKGAVGLGLNFYSAIKLSDEDVETLITDLINRLTRERSLKKMRTLIGSASPDEFAKINEELKNLM